MIKLFLLLFLAGSFLIWSGCCRCCAVDCSIDGGYFQIRLMRDGKNAVFGPDAFIDKDSIHFFYQRSPTIESNFAFIDTFQYIFIAVQNGSPILLEINNNIADTFSVTTQVTDNSSCCPHVEVTSFMRNGQIICTEECEDVVIDVEI